MNVRPFERRPVLALALFGFVLHAAFANRYGFFRDELYYIACGQHLAAGYVDHPPLIALLAKIVGVVAAGSLVGFRLAAALAGAALIWLSALTARELGGGRTAQILAALMLLVAPLFQASASLFTMNVFEPLFWTGTAIVLIVAIRDDDAKPLVWLGPIVGFGLMNKHSMAWLVVAAILGLALSPSRRLLVRREIWIAAAVATLIALPNVIWEIVHRFPTLEFMKNAQRLKNTPKSPLELVLELILLMNPLTAPVWIGGFFALFFHTELKRFRPLGSAFAAIVLLVATQNGKAYYLAPAFPLLFAAGAVWLERRLARRAVRSIAFVLLGLSGAPFIPLVVPMLPPRRIPSYMDALHIEPPREELHEPAALPQHFADMFGWPELEARVSKLYRDLPQAERDNAVIFTSNYGEASAIAWFGRHDGLPPIASGHNAWWSWGPPSDDRRTVIVIGIDRGTVETLCARVEDAPIGLHPLAMPYENEAPITVCHELVLPWSELWPRLRHYI